MVSVITQIDLDHQQWLGATLPEIALEKAGIIKPGAPVVSAWQGEEVLRVLGHVALERETPFHAVVSPLGGVALGLCGRHQRWNAALAVHALDVARLNIPPAAIIRGLRDVRWPGRFQCVDDRLVLDGAHNPAAARQLAETWRETFGSERATLIIGILCDKDARGVLAALLPLAARVLVVPVNSPRALAPAELVPLARELAPQLPCAAARDLASALRVAHSEPERVLLTGSLFLVGEALAQLAGDVMEVSLQ
jgi:dihydrofolate synthase/folylpolyglutamate synthase